ncbi:Flavin monooxygenase-like protein [Niveomyces insectorum RCEF 264]|uniref:Flavin monooxygenase-like protein n=1 Tax=Niveomyces insectorum RCEF 264 TaxID=1081102 RepID=A0A167SRR7_9HYPO|nr:Flavin monooxygenase-like protein [Niveomyces insectorum RCEF 264]
MTIDGVSGVDARAPNEVKTACSAKATNGTAPGTDGTNGGKAADKVSQTNGNADTKPSAFGSLNDGLDYDVLIIGAGQSGIFAMYRMVQLGVRAKILEAGSSEGGTWYWNRYPGARFDSESYSYIFSFSQELLDEWDWTEHFAPQPETLKYIEYMTAKFDLRKHMQFDTRVTRAQYLEDRNAWQLTDHHGRTYTARFLISAMGLLNEPTLPDIPGAADGVFKGEAWHTARWPAGQGAAATAGKRVGIIGTGATGIQTIQTIAPTVEHLTVFQRTPNWTAPLRNAKISKEEMAKIRAQYPDIFRRCLQSNACFVHGADSTSTGTGKTTAIRTVDRPAAEREQEWEALFQQRGFGKVYSVAADVYRDKAANDLYSAFHAAKIRARVRDPAVAELLVPTNHGFGTRRVPLESNYYEAYNQPNVRLVDVRSNPIARITPAGLQLENGDEFEFDVLIYATGFDAVTGAFHAVDVRGRNNVALNDLWADGGGIRTFLGLTVHNFPNLFTIMGPHQMFGNIPRSIEYAVNWTADFVAYAAAHGLTYCEATEEGMAAWTAHVHACAEGLLGNDVDSWMTGVNKNLAHKQTRTVARYTGPAPEYRRRCNEVKARNYADFVLR